MSTSNVSDAAYPDRGYEPREKQADHRSGGGKGKSQVDRFYEGAASRVHHCVVCMAGHDQPINKRRLFASIDLEFGTSERSEPLGRLIHTQRAVSATRIQAAEQRTGNGGTQHAAQ